MATDTRLSLLTQPVNVQQAILGGQQIGEGFRNQGIRDQILNQKAQAGQQQIQAGQANQAQTQGAYINNLSKSLKSLPLDQRAKVVAQQLPVLSQLGIEPSQVLSQDLSDQGLDRTIAGTQPFTALKPGASNFQKGASIRFVDEQGVTQIGTSVFDPSTGATRIESSPLQGRFVSDLGQTAEEKARTAVSTAGGKQQLTGDIQTQQEVSRQELLRPGQVRTAEQVSAVEVSAAGQKQAEQIRQQRASVRKTQFSDQRQLAAAALPRLTEAFKLAEVADQGLTGRGKLLLSRLPGLEGIDVSDSAALDSALTNLALNELQKFKGPTTDFEFGVTQNISGQLIGSRAANLARIAALQRNNWFLGREAEQFNNWTEKGGDPDQFTFNFEEIMTTGKGDFTLRQIQDTAVRNGLTIEQVIERLK